MKRLILQFSSLTLIFYFIQLRIKNQPLESLKYFDIRCELSWKYTRLEFNDFLAQNCSQYNHLSYATKGHFMVFK